MASFPRASFKGKRQASAPPSLFGHHPEHLLRPLGGEVSHSSRSRSDLDLLLPRGAVLPPSLCSCGIPVPVPRWSALHCWLAVPLLSAPAAFAGEHGRAEEVDPDLGQVILGNRSQILGFGVLGGQLTLPDEPRDRRRRSSRRTLHTRARSRRSATVRPGNGPRCRGSARRGRSGTPSSGTSPSSRRS